MGIVSLINKGLFGEGALRPVPSGQRIQRDFFAPNFELIIRPSKGAQPFAVTEEVKGFISEVIYEDNADQFDRLEIRMESQIDASGERSVLSFIDSKLFSEGHIVEVKMGYGNTLFTVGAASIVKITPDFPSEGLPTLVIEGYDLLHRAARRRPKGGVSYKGFRDSQIASIIGSRNGFDIASNDPRSFENIRKTSGIFDRTQNKGISDYEFLKKVADINGYDLFGKFDPDQKRFVLFFQPPALEKQREVFSFAYNQGDLAYRNSLLAFTPTLDAHDQSTDFEIFLIKDKKIGGSNFNAFDRLDFDAQRELRENQERRIGGKAFAKKPVDSDGTKVGFKAFGRSFQFPQHKRFKNEFQVRREIEQFIKRKKENFITGEGTIIGNEVLQSRQVHVLTGISEQFSGKYYFTKVIHRMSRDAPYTTEFSCRRVIEDAVVQSPPALSLSEVEGRIQKFKGDISLGSNF